MTPLSRGQSEAVNSEKTSSPHDGLLRHVR